MGAKGTKQTESTSQVTSNLVVSKEEREKTRQNRESREKQIENDGAYKRQDHEKKKKININEKVPKEENFETLILNQLKKHNKELVDFDLINNSLMK